MPESHAPRVLILGAGERGKEIVSAFARLGAHVFAADSFVNAPAAQVTPQSFAFDLGDERLLQALLDKVDPTFVVPCNEQPHPQVLARFAQESGSVVPSGACMDFVFDRSKMLTVAARELGLPTPRFGTASTPEQLEAALDLVGLPVVISPLNRISLLDGHVAATHEQAHAVMARFSAAGESVLVERKLEADAEIVLCAARSIDPRTGKLATWYLEPIGYEDGVSFQPCELSERALDNARSVAARIAGAIGGRGIYGVELSVAGDDVYFSGVTPFPHRVGEVTAVTQRLSDCEIFARAVLGLPLDATLISPGAACVVDYEDTIGYAEMAAALSQPESELAVGSHQAVGLATAETTDEALTRARAVAQAVRPRP